MNLFRLSAAVRGRSRMDDFLRDCFVSIGYPGLGDLEDADRAEVSKRLNRVYGYEGNELERKLEDLHTFVRVMDDGDYVLVADSGRVWLGDLGDYYYREDYDRPEADTCHRRGVTWLGVLPAAALNPALREFARELPAGGGESARAAERYPLPAEQAGLEAFAAQAPGGQLPGLGAAAAEAAAPSRLVDEGTPSGAASPSRLVDEGMPSGAASPSRLVDEGTLREAVAALREALRGDDPELRVRAAEALLRYGL
ncbi:hypothetical protein [Saccharibacillus brassicae]|uniref:Uncharacterized protein n=1 Tax=Saccharibacillus brassicae TaxID=2583377 RepID=A0A4Y6UWF3_SACBS|nr:hypothetical protein [Saccharibacillus brassicae]QDH22049.1 hypothetical protein FFV09_15075 [Saccharibacillus brassicae]